MKIDKCSKLVCNLYDKNNDVVHIRSLKQALDHGLILKKVHRELSSLLKKCGETNKGYLHISTLNTRLSN